MSESNKIMLFTNITHISDTSARIAKLQQKSRGGYFLCSPCRTHHSFDLWIYL